MSRIATLVCLLTILSAHAFCQNKELKTKFGKISDKEMAMTSYDADPAAPAVVLFDKGLLGHNYIQNVGFKLAFERHSRIKIFKKEALSLADIIVPHHKDTKVSEIKATCYNLENGKMVEVKLDKSNIFEEPITKNFNLTKFVIPGVKEGSIVEYSYTLVSAGGIGMPDEWIFQKEDVPTIWSEFDSSVPAFIEFKKMSQGWEPFTLAEESQGEELIGGDLRYTVNKLHFIQENVPALKPENHVNAPRDYLSRISFDIQAVYDIDVISAGNSYRIVNGLPTDFNRTWKVLGSELLEDVYDKDITSSKYTDEAAKSCISGKTTNQEKLMAIYEHIGTDYQVRGDYDRIFKSQPIETLVKDRKGTPTDLNLLFINMLGKVGIKAWPVLISTTDHGQVTSFRVSLDEFNRVIAAVETADNLVVLVDAAAFPNPLGLLAKEDLGGEGLLLKSKNDISWIPLQNKVALKSVVIANMSLEADGVVNGSAVWYESGYDGVSNRKAIKARGAEAMVKATFKDWFADGNISELKVANAANWNEPSLKTEFKFESGAFANVSGNKIYLSPMAGLGLHENPFKNPVRKFNIDLEPQGEIVYNLSFKIPEGYKVEEFPKGVKSYFEENDLSFEYLTENNAGVLKFNIRFKQKTNTINSGSYTDLQQFFSSIVAKMEEQVVLTKL